MPFVRDQVRALRCAGARATETQSGKVAALVTLVGPDRERVGLSALATVTGNAFAVSGDATRSGTGIGQALFESDWDDYEV